MNNIIKLKEFLENQNQTQITLKDDDLTYKKEFFKLTFGEFDFIYYLTYHNYPEFRDEAHLCGIIYKRTNQLYFAGFEIKNLFQYHNPSEIQLNNITRDTLQKQYAADIDKAYDELAKKIIEEKVPEEYDIQNIEEDAFKDYYYGEREKTEKYIPEISLKCLLDYIINPQKTIEEDMKKREENVYVDSRPSEKVKFENLRKRVAKETMDKILNSKEYEMLRLAKTMREICKDKKQVVVHYKTMKTGETLVGKLNTEMFSYAPYDIRKNIHFSIWYLDSKTREKLKEIDGHEFNDIYISNIKKLEYRGKTIYENKGE